MLEISSIKDKMSELISLFKGITKSKVSRRSFILAALLIIVSILSFYFMSTNENYYGKTIAKITSITEKESSQTDETSGYDEQGKTQQIEAVILNGIHKGKTIELQYTASDSQVYHLNFKVNDEVFVRITEDAKKEIKSSEILDYKRDKYIVYIVIIFLLTILLIGGMKGLRSLISVVVNIIIFSAVIELFICGYNLLLLASIASLLFIIVSISIVSGRNKKTVSAIVGTIVGTIFSMSIAAVVILITHANGIHYEEMEFLTHPPEQIFYIEILIGTLGAIMDIAISISSAINEMHDKNPNIERKVLIHSGMEIGKDIMGTMANTLVFAYISGSIPMILLWLKNGYSIYDIVNYNLSLEIIRALTGSIGIVISIPLTMYISVMLLKNHTIGET